MAAQYSFVMKGMTKSFPGVPKPILNNINLQFYPDAKIAIIGPNGSGKSTLMKIMAGRTKKFPGRAWPARAIESGTCPRGRILLRGRPGRETCWKKGKTHRQ